MDLGYTETGLYIRGSPLGKNGAIHVGCLQGVEDSKTRDKDDDLWGNPPGRLHSVEGLARS